MADDTRDIAIQTRADVKHLSDQVADLVRAVSSLKEDLNERKGAEKITRWIVGGASGSLGAGATILLSKLTGIPLPR